MFAEQLHVLLPQRLDARGAALLLGIPCLETVGRDGVKVRERADLGRIVDVLLLIGLHRVPSRQTI